MSFRHIAREFCPNVRGCMYTVKGIFRGVGAVPCSGQFQDSRHIEPNSIEQNMNVPYPGSWGGTEQKSCLAILYYTESRPGRGRNRRLPYRTRRWIKKGQLGKYSQGNMTKMLQKSVWPRRARRCCRKKCKNIAGANGVNWHSFVQKLRTEY